MNEYEVQIAVCGMQHPLVGDPLTIAADSKEEAVEWVEENLCFEVDGDVVEIERPHKVIVEISGGVANVKECPQDVEVDIVDHD